MERISATNSTSKKQVGKVRRWIVTVETKLNPKEIYSRYQLFEASKKEFHSAFLYICKTHVTLLIIQVWKFIRRLFYFKQMDFQYALWQAHKLLVNPQQLYKGFQYRFVLSLFMPYKLYQNNNQKNDKRPICPRWSCLFGFIGVDICNYHVILWNNEWFSDTQNALSFALVRLCWLRRTWNSGKSLKSPDGHFQKLFQNRNFSS